MHSCKANDPWRPTGKTPAAGSPTPPSATNPAPPSAPGFLPPLPPPPAPLFLLRSNKRKRSKNVSQERAPHGGTASTRIPRVRKATQITKKIYYYFSLKKVEFFPRPQPVLENRRKGSPVHRERFYQRRRPGERRNLADTTVGATNPGVRLPLFFFANVHCPGAHPHGCHSRSRRPRASPSTPFNSPLQNPLARPSKRPAAPSSPPALTDRKKGLGLF